MFINRLSAGKQLVKDYKNPSLAMNKAGILFQQTMEKF